MMDHSPKVEQKEKKERRPIDQDKVNGTMD